MDGVGGGGQKGPLSKIFHSYPTMTKLKLGTVIPYLKNPQKIYESRDTLLELCWHQHFSSEISKFCYIRKYRYKLHFGTELLILLTFFESSNIFLISMVTILMMSAKLVSLGLLKIKTFQNKCYDLIIPDYDVTNKILERDSNYIVDVVMWPKFDNFSISMREVIITWII